jgi:hypothetical protein
MTAVKGTAPTGNMKGVEGFDQRIKCIGSDETGIESGVAELFGGKILRILDVQFRYVVPGGRAGEATRNLDIEYVAGAGRVEWCEVKCNLHTTALNVNSVVNAQKTAKNQLPKGKAGVILLRILEHWTPEIDKGSTVVQDGVQGFIDRETTSRVSSVIVVAAAPIRAAIRALIASSGGTSRQR